MKRSDTHPNTDCTAPIRLTRLGRDVKGNDVLRPALDEHLHEALTHKAR